MCLKNGNYLQLCYLDFMPLPMYINTDSSLLCTLYIYPQLQHVHVALCPDLLGPIQHVTWAMVGLHLDSTSVSVLLISTQLFQKFLLRCWEDNTGLALERVWRKTWRNSYSCCSYALKHVQQSTWHSHSDSLRCMCQ